MNIKDDPSVHTAIAKFTPSKQAGGGNSKNKTPAIALHILSPIALDQCACVNFIRTPTGRPVKKNGAYMKNALKRQGADE